MGITTHWVIHRDHPTTDGAGRVKKDPWRGDDRGVDTLRTMPSSPAPGGRGRRPADRPPITPTGIVDAALDAGSLYHQTSHRGLAPLVARLAASTIRGKSA